MVMTSSRESTTESSWLMSNQSVVERDTSGFQSITYEPTLGYSNEDFWTADQLLLIESFPPVAHLVLGTFLSIICAMGIIANALVLLIFMRFKRLRTPANTFIINLAFSDFCAACFHPMAAYSSFHGRWAFGRPGCEIYGMGVGFFGIMSILTFSAIACERCIVITAKPVGGQWKITRSRARKIIGIMWIYCGVLVSLPLFGISAYVPEGLFTSCSWGYTIKSFSSRIYYLLLVILGFVLPVLLICACYATILASVIIHAREMTGLTVPSQKNSFRKLRRKTEIRTAQTIVMLILLYLFAWTPYAVVTLIGQFGPDGILTPWTTVFPAYFAKSAVVMDPIVFGLSHPRFRTSLKQYLINITQNGQDDSASNLPSNSYQSRGLTVYPNRNNTLTDDRRYSIKYRSEQRRLPTFRQLSQQASVQDKSCAATYNTTGSNDRWMDIPHTVSLRNDNLRRYRVRNGDYNSEIAVHWKFNSFNY